MYNGEFFPVAGGRSDDAGGTSGNRSTISLLLGPGTYFLAISDANTADDQPSLFGDLAPLRPISDYRGVLVNSSAATNLTLNYSITSSDVSNQIRAVKPERYGVYFAVFTVTGCVADVVGAGIPIPDGIVDGNDFIAFFNAYASGDPLADVAGPGASGPPDGIIDGDDFIAFINAYAAGC